MNTPCRANLHSYVKVAAVSLLFAAFGCGGTTSDEGPRADGVSAVALSSCTPLVYTADVTLGDSQKFQLIVDTGSTTLGVAAQGCTSCGVTPLYKPGVTAKDQMQTAKSQFGTGDWSGEIYQDSVGVGAVAGVPVDLVAIGTQSGFFSADPMCGSPTGEYEGILGLDRSGAAVMGTNGFFDQYVNTTGAADIFATRLCGTEGTLWLGGYDPAATTGAPQYTPFTSDVVDTSYYSVILSTVTVAGTAVTIPVAPYNDSVLDTGTSAFLMRGTPFNDLAAAIAATPGFQQVFGNVGASWFTTAQVPPSCTTLTQTKAQLDATLPPLTLTFGSGITIQALATESYLWSYQNQWCSALASLDTVMSSDEIPFSAVIGSPVLRSNVVIFDRANSRAGFAPHTPCAD